MGARVHVCYIPGIDRRQIDAADAPHIHRLLNEYPAAKLRTQPTTELFPTLVTGANPGAHEVWHVSLRPDADAIPRRWYDRLPDAVTTTAQCLRHFIDPTFELPAIPPRRRRRFDLHRLKFDLRQDTESVRVIGGVPALFGVLGNCSRYVVVHRFDELSAFADTLPADGVRFDMMEFHGYDLFSHWNLDRPERLRPKLAEVDAFVGRAAARCADAGVTFVLLVDHGQQVVTDSVDLRARLRESGVPDAEYDCFLAVAVARFWFHTDRARETITRMLRATPKLNVLTNDELRRYDLDFDARRFGELYAVTDQGCLFFPHDFHQPLGSLFMGLKSATMRPRLWSGRHRGYHGHLPNHPADEGYVVVADRRVAATRGEMDLVDFAPTMLAMLGEPIPSHMQGRLAFTPARDTTNACTPLAASA